MTDEKLNECCAATHGIYIKGIMCLMHKSETYGKILLKQIYKQTSSKEKNFALQLVKHLPYSLIEIEQALTELIAEKVCHYEGDYICQRRMIKDNAISEARSKAGHTGGLVSSSKKTSKKKAKRQANSEYDNEDEIEFRVPTILQVREYFKQKGYMESVADRAFEFYNVNDWKDSKGVKVKNWKMKMNSVWFKPENAIPTEQPKRMVI